MTGADFLRGGSGVVDVAGGASRPSQHILDDSWTFLWRECRNNTRGEVWPSAPTRCAGTRCVTDEVCRDMHTDGCSGVDACCVLFVIVVHTGKGRVSYELHFTHKIACTLVDPQLREKMLTKRQRRQMRKANDFTCPCTVE